MHSLPELSLRHQTPLPKGKKEKKKKTASKY
jgi:hypothetical protein